MRKFQVSDKVLVKKRKGNHASNAAQELNGSICTILIAYDDHCTLKEDSAGGGIWNDEIELYTEKEVVKPALKKEEGWGF